MRPSPPEFSRSTIYRWVYQSPVQQRILLTLASMAAFVLIAVLFHDALGPQFAILSFIPVIVSSLLFGLPVGMPILAVTLAINSIILHNLMGMPYTEILLGGSALGSFGLLACGLIGGLLRDLCVQIDKELMTRRAIQETLVEAENRYRTLAETSQKQEIALNKIFASSSLGIALLSPDLEILQSNTALERLLGYSASALFRSNFTRFLSPAHAPEFQKAFQRLFHRESSEYQTELPLEQYWVHLTATILDDAVGQPLHGLILLEDISERRLAEENLSRRMQELEALVQNSLDINSQRDLSSLLRAIVERAARLVQAPMGVLALMRSDGQSVQFVVSYHLPRDVVGDVLPLGEGVTGKVAQSGEVFWVEDYSTWDQHASQYESFGFRRAFGAPMKIGPRVIGVITILDTERVGPFSEQEIRVVRLFADQAALAVENTRLYEAAQREIVRRKQMETAERDQRLLAEALRDSASALNSTLQVGETLDQILINIEKVVPHDAANITLITNGVAHVTRSHGYEALGLADQMQTAVFQIDEIPSLATMASSGTVTVIANTQENPEWIFHPSSSWVRSYIGAPLTAKNQVLGFINLESARPNFFNQNHAFALKVFADQAAVAIENARLFEETRAREQRLSLINEISSSINQQFEMGPVLQSVVDSLAHALGVEQASLALFDDARRHLTVVADYSIPGIKSCVGVEIPLEGNLSMKQILSTREPVAILKAMEDPLFENVREVMKERQAASTLLIPLLMRGEVIGTIGCDRTNETHAFTQEEIALAETIANLAVVQIEQARLYEAERMARQDAEQGAAELRLRAHQMGLLNEITRSAILEQDLEVLCQTFADHLSELFDAEQVSLALWDSSDQKIKNFSLASRRETASFNEQQRRVQLSILRLVLNAERHFIAEDTVSDQRLPADTYPLLNTASLIGFPLIADGQKLGAVLIQYPFAQDFALEDLQLGEQAVNQIALAIAKSQSMENERKRSGQLARANSLILAFGHVAAQIEKASSPEAVMKTLGSELKKLGVQCAVTEMAEPGNKHPSLALRYLSIEPTAMALAEKLGGVRWKEYRFTPERFPFIAQLTRQPQPIFSSNPMADIIAALPGLPVPLIRHIARLANVSSQIHSVFMPLVSEDKALGGLWLWGERLEESDLPALSVFASQLATTLEKARLYAEFQQLAITDELTGLYNRRGLFELGRREIERAMRFSRPLSAIMIDIDHFKGFNDTYGHSVGDQVLKVLAERCRKNARELDLVGRYGGEEFVVLLPETDLELAVSIAQRLHTAIAAEPISTEQGELQITVSLGVTAASNKMWLFR